MKIINVIQKTFSLQRVDNGGGAYERAGDGATLNPYKIPVYH